MSDTRRRPKAEMPERRPTVDGGTIEGKPHARQADTACDESTEQSIVVTMEEVLSEHAGRLPPRRGQPAGSWESLSTVWSP
jgi:hypothetical protein